MKSKITFLILHYYSIEDTIKCIDSIDRLRYKAKDIVIVDNASPNNTGVKLEKLYKKRDDIHIILSKENLGFARGNNLGFKYAKENLNSDFIVMLNNDVYMLQENFCDLIIDEYKNSNFGILGPRILMNNNIVCAYVYSDKMPSLKELKSKLFENKIMYFFNKIYLRKIISLFIKIKNKFKNNKYIDTSIRKDDAVLQGACIIFSKQYIDKFDGIDDRTFLYHEELLLYLRVKKHNLKTIYNPYIMVYHNENSSTNKTNTDKRKKFEFVLKNEIQSLEIVIKELEK